MLAAGTAAQTSFAAVLIGLPVLAPAIRSEFDLSLVSVGFALDAFWLGSLFTLLPWGLLADRVGERLVLALGLGGCAAALVGAAHATEFVSLFVLLFLAGARGGERQRRERARRHVLVPGRRSAVSRWACGRPRSRSAV